MSHTNNDLLRLLEPFCASATGEPVPQDALALLKAAGTIVDSGEVLRLDPSTWHDYLDTTRRTRFLNCLDGREARYRWADLMFRIVAESDYSLLKMFEQRVAEHPDKPLFREVGSDVSSWSYGRVFVYMKRIAAAFFAANERPRVMTYLDNSPDGACVDLACLTFGIFDTPINLHFDQSERLDAYYSSLLPVFGDI